MEAVPNLMEYIRQILSDGEWHHFDEICARVGPMIRPEIAMRAYDAKPRLNPIKDPLRQARRSLISSRLSTMPVETRKGNGEHLIRWRAITRVCVVCGAEYEVHRIFRKRSTHQGKTCSLACGIKLGRMNRPATHNTKEETPHA